MTTILLMGPTAAGKSALALELAEAFGGEIVSVDSAQVYRDMDIGTAKPDRATRERVPHHLIDVVAPTAAYSAARFAADATVAIGTVRARGRVPIVAGGTMLYFKALTEGLSDLPGADPAIRAALDRDAAVRGWPALHAELAALDPEAAVRIRPADGQRIQRALEVLELTGERLSRLQKLASPAPLAFAAFALVPDDRVALYTRIDARFRRMMEEGFLDEVRALRARGDLDPDLPSLRSVGYRQLWTHLAGACSLEQAVAEGQRATRNLAKRQLTWIRSEPAWQPLRRLDIEELAPIEQVLRISADA